LIAAVVDTNILVRAVIKPTGSVGPVLERLRDKDYLLIYSEPLLSEFVDVINRPRIRDKYHITPEDISTVVALLILRGREIRSVERIEICRDPKDNMVLEAAIAGEAQVIVSGDEDLLTLDPFRGTPIVSPSKFLEMFDRASS
jgi:putative PIN family toxin of toxin-antitoxin system